MMRRRPLIALGACALAAPRLVPAFVDPVDSPARRSLRPELAPFLAAARAGDRVVAAGLRGRIVVSDPGGHAWTQARVPVEVDLTAVSFPTSVRGWAVGHSGVVLASDDGGTTWRRQLAQRGAQPLLDVQFTDALAGFVVGAFNTIFRTGDAGATWQSWKDRTSNPQELHLNAVRGRAGRVFLAGEQGMVWRLRDGEARFKAVPTPYQGTLFGLVVTAGVLLAFGMRGSAWRSPDEGDSWEAVRLQTVAGITAGTALGDGRIVLADQGGGLHVSSDAGRRFETTRPPPPTPWAAVAEGKAGVLVLAGAGGVRTIASS